ncbi:MAG: 16S rRNA processing protein RimM [Spirochaetales bacterium]|nr:16S rRNA processing protein RimM [Spirochaetales bacterium]
MDKLATGIVRKTFGIKGELTVVTLSGENEHLLKLKYVFIEKQDVFLKYSVEWVKEHGKNLILKLEGVDTKEKGQAFVGNTLWVNREDACPIGENEYYYSDLYRCRVFLNDALMGKIKGIFSGGSVDILEVENINGHIVMVPMSRHFVKKIDIADQKIILTEESSNL